MLPKLNTRTPEEFMEYLQYLLEGDADMVTSVDLLDEDSTDLVVKLHSGVSFIITAEVFEE